MEEEQSATTSDSQERMVRRRLLLQIMVLLEESLSSTPNRRRLRSSQSQVLSSMLMLTNSESATILDILRSSPKTRQVIAHLLRQIISQPSSSITVHVSLSARSLMEALLRIGSFSVVANPAQSTTSPLQTPKQSLES